MQFTLLMLAAAIALVGAIFHGYVCPDLYEKYPGESVSLADAVTQLSLLAHVHRLVTGERHHVFGGGVAAPLGVNGCASHVG